MRLPDVQSGLAAMLVAAALVAAVPSLAAARDRDDHRRDEHSRDEIRRAVEAGEIKSLAEILATVRGQLPGEIAGVEIERKDGRWLYEFRVIDSKGQLFDAYIDARSGEIERVKEK
jgi:uncharacterized membrane protein YkoI